MVNIHIYIYIYIYCLRAAYCLFRDYCFPDSKSYPNITVNHSYSYAMIVFSHLANRYTSFALHIPDVAF